MILENGLKALEAVGLVEVGHFAVHTRDEERIRQLEPTIIDQLLPPA